MIIGVDEHAMLSAISYKIIYVHSINIQAISVILVASKRRTVAYKSYRT
jgi:hypothetical protein